MSIESNYIRRFFWNILKMHHITTCLWNIALNNFQNKIYEKYYESNFVVYHRQKISSFFLQRTSFIGINFRLPFFISKKQISFCAMPAISMSVIRVLKCLWGKWFSSTKTYDIKGYVRNEKWKLCAHCCYIYIKLFKCTASEECGMWWIGIVIKELPFSI